jgi:hypothetical protein
MNISEKDEQLMEFIYDEYERDSVFQHFGEFGSILVEKSGIYFGDDAGAQVEAIRRLLKQGWIEIVTLGGNRIATTRVTIISRIKPTTEGIQYVESRRQCWLKRHWPRLITAITEGVVRAFKKE